MPTDVRNLYAAEPQPGSAEQFLPLLQTATFALEYILSHGQTTAPGQWYDQPRAEWVLLARGQARLRFAEEQVIELRAGDCLLIQPHQRHRVDFTSDDALWLALHFSAPEQP